MTTYIFTDQADYAPGSTAGITGSGFDVGTFVEFTLQIVNADGTLGPAVSWIAADAVDGTGSVSSSFYVDPVYANATVKLTATEVGAGADGGLSINDFTAIGPQATTLFTDSAQTLATTSATLNVTGDGVGGVTHGGVSGSLGGGAIFSQDTTGAPGPGGGASHDFLQIENNGTEQGFNVAGVMNTKNDATHNHVITLDQVGKVYADGHAADGSETGPVYREFFLTINQNVNTYISLDALKIYQSNNGALTDLSGAHQSFDLGNNWVALKDIANGVGNNPTDYHVLIPDSDFNPNDGNYVYLYSEFGAQGTNFGTDTHGHAINGSADGGFEAWSASGVNNGVPGITVDKQVSLDGGTTWLDVGNGNLSDNTAIFAGLSVEFRVVVTNTSTDGSSESGITVADTANTPGLNGVDFTFGGAGSVDLAAGSSATSDVVTVTALSGAHLDTATASGTASGGSTVTASDSANFLGITPGVTLDKQLSVDGGTTWIDHPAAAGAPVVLASVVNDGTASSTNAQVYVKAIATDTTTGGLDVTGASVSDTNGPAMIPTGVTLPGSGAPVTFTGQQSETAGVGLQTDTATVNGTVTDAAGHTQGVTASDSANYYGATASITIDKQLTGNGGTTWADVGSDQTAATILVGKTVTYQAIVTNTSDGGLGGSAVGVVDNTGLGFGGGASSLASGGSTTFTASTSALAGLHTDTATASETVSDAFGNNANPTAADSAAYYGVTAGISLDKQISGNGSSWTDVGSDLTAPVILAGVVNNGVTSSTNAQVYFQAIATNQTDGGLSVTGATVSDVNGPSLTNAGSTVGANGGTLTFSGSGTAVYGGLQTDTATVNGTVTDSFGNTASVKASDNANYYGATASISVDKLVSSNGQAYIEGGVGSLSAPTVLVGKTVNFEAVVTNTSDAGLNGATGVGVSDNTSLSFGGGATNLASGGSTTFTASTTAVAGHQVDTATAGETVTDAFGNSAAPTAQDSADYYGVTAGITLDKTVSNNGVTFDQGVSNLQAPTILVGKTLTFTAVAANTTDGGLSVTGAAVNDVGGPAMTAGSSTVGANGGTLSFTGQTSALAGQHTDTATVTGTVTDSFGNTTQVHATDQADYFGVTAGITLDKQISGNGTSWTDVGSDLTAPVILASVVNGGVTTSANSTVYFQAIATNQTTGGLSVTGASVSDVNGPALTNAGSTVGGNGGTLTFAGHGIAVAGLQTDTATVNGTVTDSFGNTAAVSAQDSANYFGAIGSISVVKQLSVNGGLTWFNEGSGAPSLGEGSNVEVRVVVTNTSTGGLGETNVSVGDVADTAGLAGSFTFGSSNATTIATLGAGQSVTSNAIIAPSVFGTHTDTATATGTVGDSFGHSGSVSASDSAHYTATFVEGVAGLTQGYWYNHQSTWDLATVAGYGQGILLGDSSGTGWKSTTLTAASIHAAGELFVPLAAAQQLINSSQTANDTRQILFSQALAAQQNIDHGDVDPGAGTTGDLIKEATAWLTGRSPYVFTDGSSGNVDRNGNGIVDLGASGDYNTAAAALTFEGAPAVSGKALTSNLMAWQKQLPIYTHPDATPLSTLGSASAAGGTVSADGEGLKNALQAFNQNQLVTDKYGHVAWNNGSFVDVTLNHANDFWAILHDQHLTGVL